MAQRLKCLPAMRETWVRSLGWEDPLGKELATHSSIVAWRIPWMEKAGGLQSTGSQRVRHDFTFTFSGKKICLPMKEVQETWVQSLGREDPLEEGMAIHSSILAWKIPWTEELGSL